MLEASAPAPTGGWSEVCGGGSPTGSLHSRECCGWVWGLVGCRYFGSPRRLGRDDDASWRSQFSILSFELPPPAPAGDGRGRCCGGGLVRWSMVGASCPDGWVVGGVWRPEVRLRASSEGPELHTTPSSRPSCHERAAGSAPSGDVAAPEHPGEWRDPVGEPAGVLVAPPQAAGGGGVVALQGLYGVQSDGVSSL